MKISVMIFPFVGMIRRGEITAMRVFQSLHTAGASGLEVAAWCLPPNIETWAKIRQAASELGMAYSCLDVPLNLVQPTDADAASMLSEGMHFIEFSRRQLNCDRVMFYGTKPLDGQSLEDARKVFGEQGARLAEFAKNFGIQVCFEDFGVYPRFVCSAQQCLDVLAASEEKLGFTFDNGNFIYGGDMPRNAFEMLAKYTRHIHLKDFKMVPWDGVGNKPENVPGTRMVYGDFGAGCCDVAWCIQSFQQAGYDGWYSVELGGSRDILAQATQAVAYCADVIRG